jgi:hypothetical protein
MYERVLSQSRLTKRSSRTSVARTPSIIDAYFALKIIEVLNKTLAFHTSVNYQIQAPEPFADDVHEDLHADLARISGQKYRSDFELHLDLSRTFKRLNDGHCIWINRCYVRFHVFFVTRYSLYLSCRMVCPIPFLFIYLTFASSAALFLNFLPTPLVLLTDGNGYQNVHIAPEAFAVVSAEFPDQIDIWQKSLPGRLRGNLQSVSEYTISDDGLTSVQLDSCPALKFCLSTVDPPFKPWMTMRRLRAPSKHLVHARTRMCSYIPHLQPFCKTAY